MLRLFCRIIDFIIKRVLNKIKRIIQAEKKVFAGAILLYNSTKIFRSVSDFSKDISGPCTECVKRFFNDFYFQKLKFIIQDIWVLKLIYQNQITRASRES